MTSRLWCADPYVSTVDDPAHITTEYRDKYTDPHTGAKATIPKEGDVVYCVRVTHAIILRIWRDGDTNGLVC